jgi:hypothetical protein
MHTGGGHHLIGDGAVRFVRDGVATGVYVAMTTREGGEVSSDEDR